MCLLLNVASWTHLLVISESTMMINEYLGLIPSCSRPTNGSGEKPPVWLALDAIQVKLKLSLYSLTTDYCIYLQDPMNFGAILRCAFFLGAEKVITTAKHWSDIIFSISIVIDQISLVLYIAVL